jgi:hypothetical protein
MSTILSYDIEEVRRTAPKNAQDIYYDITKHYCPELVGDNINKDGVLPRQIVDTCM